MSLFFSTEFIDVDGDDQDYTQLSEAAWRWGKRHAEIKIEDDPSPGHVMRNVQRLHRMAAWEAKPTNPKAKVSQHLEDIGQLFPQNASSSGRICARCEGPLPEKTECMALRTVKCDACQLCFHYSCVDLCRPPIQGSLVNRKSNTPTKDPCPKAQFLGVWLHPLTCSLCSV